MECKVILRNQVCLFTLVVGCVCMTIAVGGCEDADTECRGTIPIPPGLAPLSQPSEEDMAENRRRLERMAVMKKRELKKEDVCELIEMLTPVIAVPPAEVEKLREGYSQLTARDMLKEVGEDAYPELLKLIRTHDERKGDALVVMASQGCKAAIDAYVAIPDLGRGDVSLLRFYVPVVQGDSPAEWRRNYLKIRGQLVFDREVNEFRRR